MKNRTHLSLAAALSLLLSGASLGHAAVFAIPNDSPGGGNAFATDAWHVRCSAPTQIRARVQDKGLTYFDKTYEVFTVCTDPNPSPGSFIVDKQLATDGRDEQGDATGVLAQNPSGYARVFGCQAATIIFSCEAGDWCDGVYGGTIECVNTNFLQAQRIQNE